MSDIFDDTFLFVSVLPNGKGSTAMDLAAELKAKGKTVIYGDGTVSSTILRKMGFVTNRKEIMLALIPMGLSCDYFRIFNEKFKLNEKNNGIAFTIPLSKFTDSTRCKQQYKTVLGGDRVLKYEAIFVILNKGSVDEAIDIANSAGARGGTIIHGRGIAPQEKISLFNLMIEPEKEILMILSTEEKTPDITAALRERLSLDQPGKGILFVLDVSDAVGLFSDANEETSSD